MATELMERSLVPMPEIETKELILAKPSTAKDRVLPDLRVAVSPGRTPWSSLTIPTEVRMKLSDWGFQI